MMGVEKVNHHKATRYHKKTGFREAFCPACGHWAYVMSYQDDTRWRYMEHRAGFGDSPRCEMSCELVPRRDA
jgi:hypothetical protein